MGCDKLQHDKTNLYYFHFLKNVLRYMMIMNIYCISGMTLMTNTHDEAGDMAHIQLPASHSTLTQQTQLQSNVRRHASQPLSAL